MNNEKEMVRVESEHENPFVRWASAFVHPIEPFGDYFIQLRSSVEASAPVACSSCG